MTLERVLVVSILSLLAARIARAEETCTPVKGNEYCECKGEKFAINLKDILKFPVNDIADVSEGEAGKFTYQFSPCSPIDCSGTGSGDKTGVACQSGGTYIARNTKGANWTVQSLDPLKFKVLYGGGDKSYAPELERVAQMEFSYIDVITNVSMADNVPNTQAGTRTYVFKVVGKSVTTASSGGGGGSTAVGVVVLILMCLALAVIASVVTGVIVYYCCSKRRQGWSILQHPISKVSLSKEIKKNGEENGLPAFSIQ